MRIVLALLVGACAGPQLREGGEPGVPLALMPPSGARIDSHRPRFLWKLGAASDGGRLEICRDPACKEVLASADGKTSVEAPRDLPLGTLHWRLTGKRGERLGAPSVSRPILVDVRMTLHGRHLDLTLPEDEPKLGAQLIEMGDRAVERYAAMYAVAVPKQPIPVVIHVTSGAMAAVMASENDWHRVSGVTHPDGSIEFSLPLLGGRQPALPRGVGEFEWRFLHELNHAVVFRTMSNARDQPAWIHEGLSDRMADAWLEGPLSVPAHYRLGQLRRALATVRRVPLKELLTLDERELHQLDHKAFALFYQECFYLNRFLDSGDRRERFRALLRELPGMSRALLPTRLAARVKQLFGDLDELDRKLEASLLAEPPARWQPLYGDTRPLGDDAVALLSGRGVIAAASVVAEPLVPSRISASVGDSDAESVLLLFGVVSDDDFYAVRFSRTRPSALSHAVPGGWKRLGEGTIAGPATEIAVSLAGGRLRATADGKEVLDVAAPPLGKGTWGVAVEEGRAAFEKVLATP